MIVILKVNRNNHNIIELSNLILRKPIKIPESKGFLNKIDTNKNIMYTFLSGEMRKIWLHHFAGTNGIIFMYNGDIINKALNEILTFLSNENLKEIPILMVFDKDKINSEKYELIMENFKSNVLKINKNSSEIIVNFKDLTPKSEFYKGLNWLENKIN